MKYNFFSRLLKLKCEFKSSLLLFFRSLKSVFLTLFFSRVNLLVERAYVLYTTIKILLRPRETELSIDLMCLPPVLW